MVLTTAGFVAIEKIKAGDIVISTNPDTLETAEKPVLETYVRQVDKLVHLTINGEKIVTTDNHPFFVQGRGFIEAGKLLVGDKLISVNGEDLIIEKFFIEKAAEPVDVYNFQVEDYHTYFVGGNKVWVHNVDCMPTEKQKGFVSSKKNSDGSITVTKTIDGKNVDIKYTKANDGH
jgi:intein/homing endonuclease